MPQAQALRTPGDHLTAVTESALADAILAHLAGR